MKKGKLIGRGMTAEVYEWGSDKVLKLFFKKFDEERVKYEADIGYIVHESGVPSPAVFDIIDLDDRKGIIFQRISGTSLTKKIQTEPWNYNYYVQKLAQLQFKIHQCTSDKLPSQKERLSFIINKSAQKLGAREKIILDYLDKLPDGVSICHGDLHLNNVIVSNNELIAIDWNSAYRGNPLSDVARTFLMVYSPIKSLSSNDFMTNFTQYIRWLSLRGYLSEYMKLANVNFESIDEWMLPIAAGKLKDNVPGDKIRLMNIINERLELYVNDTNKV